MFKNILCFLGLCFYASQAYSEFVKVEWQHYTSPPKIKEQLSDYVFIKSDYSFDFIKGPFAFDSSFKLEYSLDKKELYYFNVPELYLFYKQDFTKAFYYINSIEVYLGRKIKTWSEGDKFWKLSLWNPLMYWNPFEPNTSGLIGSFFTFNSEVWTADFFIGALYLPSAYPRMLQREDQSYSSQTRWGFILPDQVESYNLDIYYSLVMPVIIDLLFQQSFFFSFKTWSKNPDTYYWIKWSFADKPTNHMYYVLNTQNRFTMNQSKDSSSYIDQSITAISARQRILSTEWGLDYKKLSMIFSLENVKIKEDTQVQQTWRFVNSREDFTYFSLLLKYQYLDSQLVELGFIQSWFKNYDFYTSSSKIPSLQQQSKILEGVSIGWKGETLTHKKLPLRFNVKYQYSFLETGAWLNAKIMYYLTAQLYTELSIDVIGVQDTSNLNQTSANLSFLNKFKHNDYITWGIAYDF